MGELVAYLHITLTLSSKTHKPILLLPYEGRLLKLFLIIVGSTRKQTTHLL